MPDLLGETRRGTRAHGAGGVVSALAAAGIHTAFIASDWLERYARIEGFSERRHPAARYGHFADEAVSEQALKFLEQPRNGPFFLFVHFLGAHEPYDPAPDCAAAPSYARYLCALTALDRRVDALYQALDRSGRLTSTVFVVSADHGEEFGEHGGRYHATTLYDEILRVPLVVAAPGIGPELVNEPLGCFDFLPTVLARAGIELEADWLGCDRLRPARQAAAANRRARAALPSTHASSPGSMPSWQVVTSWCSIGPRVSTAPSIYWPIPARPGRCRAQPGRSATSSPGAWTPGFRRKPQAIGNPSRSGRRA